MTQALNCAAAGGEAAVNSKAQGISQNRILGHSFLHAPDWTLFVSLLNRRRFRFDIPGLSTMYPNVPQARSSHIQHLNLSHKAITPDGRQTSPWDYFTFVRYPPTISKHYAT
jgi:hypothetical protein